MKRFALTIEYDGTAYVGWQHQENGLSVQQVLEEALFSLSQESITTHVAGRTDAGVHALGQVAHFDLKRDMPLKSLREGLNFHLKKSDVCIVEARDVAQDFHARISATERHYLYRVLNRPSPSALLKKRVWFVPKLLDVDAMHVAAQDLVGHHDFTSFRAAACQAKSPLKSINSFVVERHGDEVHFKVAARSFLHNQVRNMVGTLVEIGRDRLSKDTIPEILKAKDRAAAGVRAPAHGLYFVKVNYSKFC